MLVKKPRACAALIKGESILMVREVNPTKEYWTLPGGGLEEGETFEEAVVREVHEEVNLKVKVVKYLFSSFYEEGIEKCFLVKETEKQQCPSLGYDPELPKDKQTLIEVQWKSIKTMKDDIQIAEVIKAMNLEVN
jgi:8-oxo-dGTP diphosphatase